MMKKTTILISILLLSGHFLPVCAQEQPLRDFAEDRTEHKFCFYPSTLRMLNLSNNPDFNKLANGIQKLLVFNLDSTARADKAYKQLITTYQELDYEELASAYGGEMNFYVYGKEKGEDSEYIGVIRKQDMTTAFYLRGQLAVSVLPGLMESMNASDFINPFDFNLSDFGKGTQDK
ncbi:MAG: DUF4252 domain-containing protein [Bacteroidales bacterium]|nr:DUF4252 domain-containing protein [Bacteroidales bacterium]